jgi:hypothetical protein
MEYVNARALLISIVDGSNLDGESIRKLRMDALIHFSASLLRAIILTNDKDHFERISRHAKGNTPEMMPPILSLQQASDSLNIAVEI